MRAARFLGVAGGRLRAEAQRGAERARRPGAAFADGLESRAIRVAAARWQVRIDGAWTNDAHEEMHAIEVKVPQLSESVAEATLSTGTRSPARP